MKSDEIGKVFEEWNKGELSSFLIEITADILQQKDPMSKEFLVDMILDTAGQKGTGQWTAANALELGAPANAIAAAVYARALSSVKEERVAASKILKGPKVTAIPDSEKKATIEAIKNALYCSKICAYAQGFQLIDKAQVAYNWKLNFGEISQIWRGGCIIRARFLQKITDAYSLNSRLKNLMLDPYFTEEMNKGQEGWRKVIALAVTNGIPAQGFAAALAYYDGYRSADLPANLLQGQRDYFGAHTYERKDRPRGEFFHLDWPEPGRPQIAID
jgi:6-phosphogluconate dehydrogenase